MKQELYFWNQETSYMNALYSNSCPNYIEYLKILKGLSVLSFTVSLLGHVHHLRQPESEWRQCNCGETTGEKETVSSCEAFVL